MTVTRIKSSLNKVWVQKKTSINYINYICPYWKVSKTEATVSVSVQNTTEAESNGTTIIHHGTEYLKTVISDAVATIKFSGSGKYNLYIPGKILRLIVDALSQLVVLTVDLFQGIKKTVFSSSFSSDITTKTLRETCALQKSQRKNKKKGTTSS